MAKLTIEQRDDVRVWLRERITADPNFAHYVDGRDATRALGFEVTNPQVRRALRDLFALSAEDQRRVQEWLATNWSNISVEGYEGQVQWRSPDPIAQLLTKILGVNITPDHIEEARAAMGKEWATQRALGTVSHWAHPGHYIEDYDDIYVWSDVSHPVAKLTVVAGGDPDVLREFLQNMLEKVDALIAEANEIEQEMRCSL